jgi:hypothetical protein
MAAQLIGKRQFEVAEQVVRAVYEAQEGFNSMPRS